MDQSAIMVTGSAGFIGAQVIRRLTEQQHTVVAVYRRKLPDSLDRVYPVCADFSSPELMAAPLRGVGTVIHLAWEGGFAGSLISSNGAPSDPSQSTSGCNLSILRNLLTAMERSATPRIIMLSAIGASPTASSQFLREKYAAESLLINSRIPEKIIIRSSITWGGQSANDRFLRSLLRVMRFPVYPVPSREKTISPIHVHDLAEIISNTCKIKLSETVVLTEVHGREHYNIGEVFRLVAAQLAKSSRFPLGGVLGKSLLPLFERDRRSNGDTPSVQQILGVEGHADVGLTVSNPLQSVIPKNLTAFRESILK